MLSEIKLEEGEIKSETFISESCSKKRKIDEMSLEADSIKDKEIKLYKFGVTDYDTRTNEEKYRRFYSVEELNYFLKKNEEIKYNYNNKAHLSGDFVTKRFMYYRIDSARREVENKYKSHEHRLYDKEVWLKRTKDDLMKKENTIRELEDEKQALLEIISKLKYNNEVITAKAVQLEKHNVEISTQMYNILINQTAINQMLLNKQEANNIGYGARVMQ